MIRVLALLLGATLVPSSFAGTQVDQIKQSARFVSEQFAPISGVASFDCNNESIAYLDSFISRQLSTIVKTHYTQDRFITLFGSFLGECVVSLYGGKWVEAKDGGVYVEVPANGKISIVQPFHKVAKRIQFGEPESLVIYFRDLLPAALGKPK